MRCSLVLSYYLYGGGAARRPEKTTCRVSRVFMVVIISTSDFASRFSST